MSKESPNEFKIINKNERLKYRQTINELKQQLEEKDQQIKKRVMVYEKQFIVQTNEIYSLKQQLAEKQNTIDEINKEFLQAVHDWKTLCAEKDKEIEMLNAIKNNAIECADLFKVALSVRQKDLAIQELEKTLNFIENVFDKALKNCSLNNGYYDQILDFIDQQIKELKGE